MGWNFNLLDSRGEPTNSFYDPEKSRDGGGYWQYKGNCNYCAWAECSEGLTTYQLISFHVDDSSCGWYGTRCYAHVYAEHRGWYFSWGSMDGFSNEGRDKALAEISAATGIDEPALIEILKQSFDTVSKLAKDKWNETHPNPAKGGWLD